MGIVPLFLIGVFAEFLAWKMGETIPLTEIAQRQLQNPSILFMPFREKDTARYKLIRLAQIRPEIITLGESRGTQFRSAMFAPYTFYNFATDGWPYRFQLDVLSRLLQVYSPRVIFLNVDFFVFSSAYDKGLSGNAPQLDPKPWLDHLNLLHDSFLEGITHPYLLFKRGPEETYRRPYIGLRVSEDSWGLRGDGSETLPSWILPSAGKNPPPFSKVEADLHARSSQMDSREVTDFEAIIKLAHSKGVTVIGFQAPFYDPVLRIIEKSPHYGILADFEAHEANGFFDRLGIIFFDFLRFPPYSQNYSYFRDPFHPTEVVDAAMVLKMSEDHRVKEVLPALDSAALHRALQGDLKARQHLFLYPN